VTRRQPEETTPPTVAIVVWGIVEDYLDPLGVSLDQLCREFTGSYVFGYAAALRRAGVRPVLIYVSCRVTAPVRCTHGPSGAAMCILPASRVRRWLRAYIRNPEGRSVRDMFWPLVGLRRLFFPALALLRETLLYLETPLIRLARELRREQCSVLLCQEYEYPRFDACVLLGRILRMPVFATFQGGTYQASRLERLSRPLAMRLSDGVVVASAVEAARVRSRYAIAADKIAHIFNPIDADAWSPVDRATFRAKLSIPPTASVAVWHGRVSFHNKGLDILLDAWKRVCNARPSSILRLILIGSGDDAEKLRHAIAGSATIQWIDEFVHDRSLLRGYLAAADVYVFPSRYEGFAVAPIEAMACGLPVVAADVLGISDLLPHGEASGGVVVPREDPQALAVAIGRFFDDEAWRRIMSDRARHRVDEGFTLTSVGPQLRAFLCDAGVDRG